MTLKLIFALLLSVGNVQLGSAARIGEVTDNLNGGGAPDPSQAMQPGPCVHINTASKRSLMSIAGVGKALAKLIDAGRCYETLENVEDKLGPQMWGSVKHLFESGTLCIDPGSYAKCSGEDEIVRHVWVDVNTASLALLKNVGLDSGLAKSIISRRCYKDPRSFGYQMKAMDARLGTDHWVLVEPFTKPGSPHRLYVDRFGWLACTGNGPKNDQPTKDDDNWSPDHDNWYPDRNDEGKGGAHPARPPATWNTTSEVLLECDSMKRLPPRRNVGKSVAPDKVRNEMRYVFFKSGGRQTVTFLPRSESREETCRRMHPGGEPTTSDTATFEHSIGVCVLVKGEDGHEKAIEYSEYNTIRNLPNFVAFRVEGKRSKFSSTECRADWTSICPSKKRGVRLDKLEAMCDDIVDYPFGPAMVTADGACPVEDDACAAKVDSRGHMAPVNDFSYHKDSCTATMNFVNVFPSRNDVKTGNSFDADTWALREHNVPNYLMRKGETVGKTLEALVVVGVSSESDGYIPGKRLDSKRKPIESIDVPTFAWTAVYDISENKATGWLCRNGLTNKHPCYCVDALSIQELEARVGHAIFPQLKNVAGLDLSDGSHEDFWRDIADGINSVN